MLLTSVLCFILSFLLTGLLRKYSLAKNIVDIPNHRSSHSLPTPRGGGLAFVVLFLLVLPLCFYSGFIERSLFFALMMSGVIVAGLGFGDDVAEIPARWRFVGHFIAAGIILFWFGGLPPINILAWTLFPGALSSILALFYLVWLVNLYNFMDGINGLASIEAITACLGMISLYWLMGHTDIMPLPLVLSLAVSGFLLWNFPIPRIFMGDAGSGFLGMTLGAFSIQAAWVDVKLFYCWLILLGVFIVDASLTLFRRMLSGEKIYEAHRSHAYQHAAMRLKSHTPVTLAVLLINILWLFPIAILVCLGTLKGFYGLLIAYIPLFLLAMRLKAGQVQLQAN
ncbi:MraY family glycosyltransferase [Legionella impletisoli]|uniref:Glycosyl transferase n=1 Tax=Legionella impletisoli TaxID=343510 RepID=A0A917N9M3_9GAMM|nr:glycosyltransferase family 4 protein [Legionella impletisoli]GGI80162.1 glycosyl transferase [Legionella impletisoli]